MTQSGERTATYCTRPSFARKTFSTMSLGQQLCGIFYDQRPIGVVDWWTISFVELGLVHIHKPSVEFSINLVKWCSHFIVIDFLCFFKNDPLRGLEIVSVIWGTFGLALSFIPLAGFAWQHGSTWVYVSRICMLNRRLSSSSYSSWDHDVYKDKQTDRRTGRARSTRLLTLIKKIYIYFIWSETITSACYILFKEYIYIYILFYSTSKLKKI